jgi:major vault protein
MADQVIRLKPFYYIHVLDNNTNVTSVEVGPQTFTVSDHQTVVLNPTAMIIIPPRHYCIISNPVVRDDKGAAVTDRHGQVKLRHGDEEVRQSQTPFALYPGESLYGKVSPLQVVAPLTSIKLRAIRDFEGHTAGEEWLFHGPGTYIPRVEVQVVEVVRATIIQPNEALRLRAKKEFTDRTEQERKTGEEWLVRKTGSFTPDVNEEIVQTVVGIVLTDKKALQLEATRTFTDCYKIERKAGEQWLVTKKNGVLHIPDVFERVVGEVAITTLNSRQYAVVLDPISSETGKPQLGMRELRKGECSFFLNPGERLESGIQSVYVLSSEEALLLQAREAFADGEVTRQPGDRWMISGPCDYVPPVTVEIVEKRRAFPLDENEGIYVRDIKTGKVRAISGKVYMLSPYEELWEKELPQIVEDLLTQEADQSAGLAPTTKVKRDKTRVVTYQIPHSTAVQIYDYKEKKPRVIFGPDLIMLGPDEQFTVLSLSGGTPKVPKQLNVLALLLGPRFSTDVVVVETADHARLSLKLSYNWHFDVPRDNNQQAKAATVFSVPDFIGDFCKAIASRVRGSVAQRTFDDFHKHSAELIRTAVFGKDDEGNPKTTLPFKANNLLVTGIDIQSVEPVDSKTRDALQKSVQLAIEITTKSQEAAARHEAERREQEARGQLERQKIDDEAGAEAARRELLELQSKSMVVESTGQATAEENARSAALKIEGEAKVKQATQVSEAAGIVATNKLSLLKEEQAADIQYQRELNKLEITRAQQLANIEAEKFKSVVEAVGAKTLAGIADSGPALQKKMLQGLGLRSFVITDGSTPVNLFNGAGGQIGLHNK